MTSFPAPARLLMIPLLFALGSAAASAESSAPAGPAQRWDQRYDRETYVYGEEPVVFLAEQIERLRKGKALVLAAGEGRNAVYLAQQGFQVVAVDISAKGLEKGRALAQSRGVVTASDPETPTISSAPTSCWPPSPASASATTRIPW